MDHNDEFLRWTNIKDVFSNMSAPEKLKTFDHFKNSNEIDIDEFNIFEPGDQGFGSSSIINPGCVGTGHCIRFVFRGEDTDASFNGYLMTEKAKSLFSDAHISEEDEIIFGPLSEFDHNMPSACRPEDWRLFSHKGRIYSNYSNYYYLDRGYPQKTVRCSMGLSVVLEKRMQFLRECDPSRIGMGESLLEKNWAFFSHGDRIKAVYCCEPWIVITFDDSGNPLSYDRQNFKIPRLGSQYMACSPNPREVQFEDMEPCYLMFIHQYLYPDSTSKGSRKRTYYQHALTFDKETLRPTAWTPKPILGGGVSTPGQFSGVLYVSSLVVKRQYLYAIAGIGDSSSSYFRMPLEDIKKNLYRL